MLFIPLSDDNPLRFVRYQWVTIGIIAVNVVVFILQISGLGLAIGTSLAVIPSELLQVRVVAGSARGPFDSLAVPEALDAPHLHVPAHGRDPPGVEHDVPVGVRRQRRGRHGPPQVSGVLPSVRRRRRPDAGHDAARLAAAADRRERRRRRDDRRLPDPAPARAGVGAGVPRRSAARHGHLDSRAVGGNATVHDPDQPRRPGGLVGPHRRRGRRQRCSFRSCGGPTFPCSIAAHSRPTARETPGGASIGPAFSIAASCGCAIPSAG